MATAREIMTSHVECVSADATLSEAAHTMSRLEVGALPICNSEGHICGILTERDIVVKCLAAGADPFSVRAERVADGQPIAVQADESAATAAAAMADNQVRRLVVLSGSEVVGIITEADLARGLEPEEFASTMRSILSGPSSRFRPMRSPYGRTGRQSLFAHFLDRINGSSRQRERSAPERTAPEQRGS